MNQADDLVIAIGSIKNLLSPSKCRVLLRQKGNKYRQVGMIKKITLTADLNGLEVIIWLPKFSRSKKLAVMRSVTSFWAKELSKFKNVRIKYVQSIVTTPEPKKV